MKVIRSLENKVVLLKGITRKNISHEGGFLNFFCPLLKSGLPYVKDVLLPLGLTAATSAVDMAIKKNSFWIWQDCTDILKQRNGRYHENS